jgi:hypothetical protein
VSGEWAVASGLGGNVGPTRSPAAPPAPDSDWDRLTKGATGRRQVGEGRSWEFFDEPEEDRPKAGAGAGAAASGATLAGSDDHPTMSLPHWTEPPSGEVPRILGGDTAAAASTPTPAEDDELSAWSALSTSPRWRDQPADWDEADFSDTVLDDREARVGALRDQPDADDDIFAFDAVAAPAPTTPPAATPSRATATQVRPPSRRSRPRPASGPPSRPPAGAGPGLPGGAGTGTGTGSCLS